MQKRRAYSNTTGRMAEERFKRAAETMGMTVEKSSRDEDINGHVDYWLSLEGNGRWGVDVKGNNLPDEIWVEFSNVNGNPGWMYGDAYVIAFDMPEEGGFCVVDREDLLEYCENNVSKSRVYDKAKAYKKRYTRKDRDDVISLLHLKDLKSLITYRVWKYKTKY